MRRECLPIFFVTAITLASVSMGWAATNFRVLHSFGGPGDGSFVSAEPGLDPRGNLYGETNAGGDLTQCGGIGCGIVFELTLNGANEWQESIIFAFTNETGGASAAGVVVSSSGVLFGGTTPAGPRPSRAGFSVDHRGRGMEFHSHLPRRRLLSGARQRGSPLRRFLSWRESMGCAWAIVLRLRRVDLRGAIQPWCEQWKGWLVANPTA